jgi:3-isopropylmalate/(R)-2-methylmalate dehydratase small subunit
VARDPENPEITVDLESQKVFAPNGIEYDFDIDPFLKQCLLEGLDDIGLTMQKDGEIENFESEQAARQPWLYRAAS